MRESFRTIIQSAAAEIKVKGSRFLGEIHPVSSVNETDNLLVSCRKKYHDATHRCYAYRIGEDAAIYRYSDDGEPAGTAGKPLLSMLEHSDLTNTLLIVIRYFGGIKLGTGGLVRAYTDAAREVIRNADIVTTVIRTNLKVIFPYEYTSGVMKTVARYDLKIIDTEYGDDVSIVLGIIPSQTETVKNDLSDVTSGNISFSQHSHRL
jgi:uncharacterized YigZ family protein